MEDTLISNHWSHHNTLNNPSYSILPIASNLSNIPSAMIPNSTCNTTEVPPQDLFCSVYDFVVESVLMGTLCLFGFIGNSLSAICLWKDRSKTATPFLLVSLEIADTSFLITVVMLRVLDSIQTYTGALPIMDSWSPYLGKYLYPCAMSAETGTIYLTILVTFNRYISVCKPYDVTYRCSIQHARKHVIAVWIIAVLYNAPRFFEYDVKLEDQTITFCENSTLRVNKYEGIPNLKPSHLLENSVYQIVYLNALYFLVMFLIPLISLIVLNSMLVVALRRTKVKRESMRNRSSYQTNGVGGSGAQSSRSEDDITFMLIIVVIVFVISQTPALITQILRMFDDFKWKSVSKKCPSELFYYERISDLLIVANSSLNFIIYCFCSRRFRQILINLICGSGNRSQSFKLRPTRNHGPEEQPILGTSSPGRTTSPGGQRSLMAVVATSYKGVAKIENLLIQNYKHEENVEMIERENKEDENENVDC